MVSDGACVCFAFFPRWQEASLFSLSLFLSPSLARECHNQDRSEVVWLLMFDILADDDILMWVVMLMIIR